MHPVGVVGPLKGRRRRAAQHAREAVEGQPLRQLRRIEAVVAQLAAVQRGVDVPAARHRQGQRLDRLAGREHQVADAGALRERRRGVVRHPALRGDRRHLVRPVALTPAVGGDRVAVPAAGGYGARAPLLVSGRVVVRVGERGAVGNPRDPVIRLPEGAGLVAAVDVVGLDGPVPVVGGHRPAQGNLCRTRPRDLKIRGTYSVPCRLDNHLPALRGDDRHLVGPAAPTPAVGRDRVAVPAARAYGARAPRLVPGRVVVRVGERGAVVDPRDPVIRLNQGAGLVAAVDVVGLDGPVPVVGGRRPAQGNLRRTRRLDFKIRRSTRRLAKDI